MPLWTATALGERIEQRTLVDTIGEEEKTVALSKFDIMRAKNTLIGRFEDNYWEIDNQTNRVGINFNFEDCRFAIAQQKEITYDDFVLSVKFFIALSFGRYTLVMYPRIVNNIKRAVKETACFTFMPADKTSLQLFGVNTFLSLLPWADESFLFETAPTQRMQRRSLAEYQSYFLFNDILMSFWASASDAEKDYFYPIYLWWEITMVLPLRVTEFSVLPKNCVDYRNGRVYLLIRRTALKGKPLTERYTIEDDYEKREYEITAKIAADINDYRARVKKYDESTIDSIFSDTAYLMTKIALFPNSRITKKHYKHMRTSRFDECLNLFFEYVVYNKFGYEYVDKCDYLQADEDGFVHELTDNEIIKFSLGDSRHIALQNLILNGCNMLTVKEISGHETINDAFHYAGNVTNLVKCRVLLLYNEYRRNGHKIESDLLSDECKQRALKILSWIDDPGIEIDGGKCHSPNFAHNDYTDCFHVLGKCSKCPYYECDESSVEADRIDYEEQIARVKIWIQSLAKLKDYEDLMNKAENMSHAGAIYEASLLKSIIKGDRHNEQ